MAGYEIKLTSCGNGTFLVTSLVLTELTTFGRTRDSAMDIAQIAIQEVIAKRIADDRDVPGMQKEGSLIVHLPLLTMAKIELYLAIRAAGMRRNDLSRVTEIPVVKIDQMLDLNNQSSIPMIESAMSALGRRFDLGASAAKQAAAVA